MFESLRGTLVGLLTEKLGTTLMNEEAIGAWDKTYSVIIFDSKRNIIENLRSVIKFVYFIK